MNLRDKIQSNIFIDSNNCWIWQGSKNPKGYGNISVNGQSLNSHRVSYEVFVKPIPQGLEVDHLCRVPSCCNPTHLEPVTRQENTLRGTGPTALNAKKTKCPKGHDYDFIDSRGYRVCRRCKKH